MNTGRVFEYLNKYKDIPTYQLERRVDSLVLPYLEMALKSKLNEIEVDADDLVLVYPEFPLRPSEFSVDKRSKHADYLLWSSNLNTAYFIEFKTDVGSVDESQFVNYLSNCKKGWKELLTFYLEKAIGNGHWRKFVSGWNCLNEGAGLLGNHADRNLNGFLEDPKGIHKQFTEIRGSLVFETDPEVRFLYLAPKISSVKLDRYKEKHDSEGNVYLGLITLKDLSQFCNPEFAKFLVELDRKK